MRNPTAFPLTTGLAAAANTLTQPKPLRFKRRAQQARFLPFAHKIVYHHSDRLVGISLTQRVQTLTGEATCERDLTHSVTTVSHSSSSRMCVHHATNSACEMA